MSLPVVPLTLEPFFDPTKPMQGTTKAAVVSPDPSKYHDAAAVGGVGRGPAGIAGTVIPQQTAGGGSVVNPEQPAGISIIIDADGTGGPPVRMAVEDYLRGGPVAAVPAATPQETVPDVLNHSPVVPVAGPTEPNVRVRFEIEHFGEQESWYHDVVKTSRADGTTAFLVLVYDRRYKGPYYMPGDMASPLGVRVAQEKVVYLAHSTGMRFTHRQLEYCVLIVEKEAPYTAHDA